MLDTLARFPGAFPAQSCFQPYKLGSPRLSQIVPPKPTYLRPATERADDLCRIIATLLALNTALTARNRVLQSKFGHQNTAAGMVNAGLREPEWPVATVSDETALRLDSAKPLGDVERRLPASTTCFSNLTFRQAQVLQLVLAGNPSKNIAADMGISQRTVENHRAAIMRRTGATSLPALARMAVGAANSADTSASAPQSVIN
jgi:DNA-binding NarL/FixJ family response regulator